MQPFPSASSGSADSAEHHYFSMLREGRFVLPQCQACRRHHFYPRVVCPHCGSNELAWTDASGLGTVYSTTVVRSKHSAHNVCLVDLAEGPRLMSRVVDIEPDAVRIGMAVTARVDIVDDAPLLVFVAQEA